MRTYDHASVERSDLFAPGTVVAEQSLQPIRSLSDVEPERELMMAVLKDAVYCVWTYCNAPDRRGRQLFLADKRWMLSGDRSSFFCFETICETLGLDPGHIRQATFP